MLLYSDSTITSNSQTKAVKAPTMINQLLALFVNEIIVGTNLLYSKRAMTFTESQ
jgi:hypothetical protein